MKNGDKVRVMVPNMHLDKNEIYTIDYVIKGESGHEYFVLKEKPYWQAFDINRFLKG